MNLVERTINYVANKDWAINVEWGITQLSKSLMAMSSDASYNQLWEDLFEHISYVQLVSPLLISDYKTGKFKLSQLAIKYRISYYQAQRIKAKIDD